jgi:hypothetical protein
MVGDLEDDGVELSALTASDDNKFKWGRRSALRKNTIAIAAPESSTYAKRKEALQGSF